MKRTIKTLGNHVTSSLPKKEKALLLDVVYEIDGKLVRMNQLLKANARPIGVIVPYITQEGQEKELIVYYDDEHSMLSLSDARIYAWYKFPCYQGSHWRVKNTKDDQHMREMLPIINALCRRLGGKSVSGLYIDSEARNQLVTPKHKIRYVCDVPV